MFKTCFETHFPPLTIITYSHLIRKENCICKEEDETNNLWSQQEWNDKRKMECEERRRWNTKKEGNVVEQNAKKEGDKK